jgi:hypothetical protein
LWSASFALIAGDTAMVIARADPPHAANHIGLRRATIATASLLCEGGAIPRKALLLRVMALLLRVKAGLDPAIGARTIGGGWPGQAPKASG